MWFLPHSMCIFTLFAPGFCVLVINRNSMDKSKYTPGAYDSPLIINIYSLTDRAIDYQNVKPLNHLSNSFDYDARKSPNHDFPPSRALSNNFWLRSDAKLKSYGHEFTWNSPGSKDRVIWRYCGWYLTSSAKAKARQLSISPEVWSKKHVEINL